MPTPKTLFAARVAELLDVDALLAEARNAINMHRPSSDEHEAQELQRLRDVTHLLHRRAALQDSLQEEAVKLLKAFERLDTLVSEEERLCAKVDALPNDAEFGSPEEFRQSQAIRAVFKELTELRLDIKNAAIDLVREKPGHVLVEVA